MNLKNPLLRILTVMVTIFAFTAAVAQTASAAPQPKAGGISSPKDFADREKYALSVAAAVEVSVAKKGFAKFKDYDGVAHEVSIKSGTVVLDGDTPFTVLVGGGPAGATGPWCDAKVATAAAAIVALGAAAISFAIAAASASTVVTIVGLSLRASVWKQIQAVAAGGTALTVLLRTLVC